MQKRLIALAFGMLFVSSSVVLAQTTASSCLNNTRHDGECKDCCDNLDGVDAAARKSCRDECATHDFTQNTDFITINAPSQFGPDGDYSACTSAKSEPACKDCCDSSTALQGGDRRFCRDACNAKFGGADRKASDKQRPPKPAQGENRPQQAQKGNRAKNDSQRPPRPEDRSRKEGGKQGNNPPANGQGGGYSVAQAISDRAQLTTIAFAGLAFLTGDLCGDTFLPPGKVSDFFGFQYLRDTDSGEMGHNTTFVPRSANNMLYILNDAQKAELIALAKAQVTQINQFGYQRFPLMKAFRRQLEGDLPAGSKGLNQEAVMQYSAELYRLDGQLSLQRAQVLGRIIRSLDQKQRAYLDDMKAGNSLSWPDLPDQVDKRSYTPEEHVAIMTYASEMFSWYAGSVEADTYFCPERHGMYFGAFYMKDIPAMGNPDYSIGTQITGDSGEAFLNVLTEAQRRQITSLVDLQRTALQQIVTTRQAIATQLRQLMKADKIDEAAILSLAEQYGSADGELSYLYATHFAEVNKTLSSIQKAQLMKLRNLEGFTCQGAYLYSQNIAMPKIQNTDFLF